MGDNDNNNRSEMRALMEYGSQVPNVTTILEVGSHHGKDAETLQQYFGVEPSSVYIVEAHPKFYENIKTNYSGYNVFNFAAHDHAGQVQFNAAQNEDDGRSSVLDRDLYIDEGGFEKITVPSKRLDTFLDEQGIESVDIFKLDVEGLSYEVLVGLGESIHKIKCLQIEDETTQIWKDQKTVYQTGTYLRYHGFEEVWRCIVGKQIDTVWLKK